MKNVSVAISFLAILILSVSVSAQSLPATHTVHVERDCYVATMLTNLPGVFGGCSWGTPRFGLGVFGGGYHPLPPISRFGGDGEAFGMVRWSVGIFNMELYLGMGINALTESGSGRASFVVGTTPQPVGLFVNAVTNYYPHALNFSSSQDFNGGQCDAEFRIGPQFKVAGNHPIVMIPWLGMGFADSRDLGHWSGRFGGLVVFSL